MKTLTKFKFCLTRLALLVLCLAWLAPQAHADVTVWVQANSAPRMYVFNPSGTCSGTVSGTAYSSYTSWSGNNGGALMTKSVTTSDNKVWYYEVFEGLNSASIIFNNGNGSQTSDITGVSGTKYFYYSGSNKHIDLTECKGKDAYCFLETSPTYWEQASARFQVWDGSADVWMTKVGGIKNGNSIYLYSKASTVTDGTTFYFKRMSSDGSSKWNEGSAPYHIGGYYTNTGWNSVAYQSGSSFGTIVWPEMPVTSTYTVTGIASPTEGGTVTPASTADLVTGNTVTLTATPATGYTFNGWSVSGTTNYTENGNSITVTVASSNVTATANFTAIPNEYTIHVIEYKGGTPYLYVFNAGSANSESFPGPKMTETEVSAAGETWYTTEINTTASTISVIASLGGSNSQTADITGIAPGDYYIVFNGTTKEIIYQGTTMPEGKQQAEKNTFTVYVKADAAPYIYLWDDNDVALNNKVWPGEQISDTEQLADGNTWYKYVVETYDNGINLLFHNNGGGDSNQTDDIKQTAAVGYYIYDGTTGYKAVPEPTGKLYAIGQVAGNPWSATMGKEMTAAGNGIFTLSNVQIIAGSTFAFATRMADEGMTDAAAWAMLNRYRLTSAADGDYWGVTNAMTNKDNPTALELRLWNGADKNFKMDETAYYDITVDMNAMTVTIKRRYGALYMFYGDSNSPYWKPNAGVPMFTTDGKTFMLTNVNLKEGDTFQFATQLGADENTWPANTYRYGANSDGNNKWLVTESQIDVVLENALLHESTNDFKMESGTAGNYRVVVNPEAQTVALYRMADVTGSKVIIHLEKTSNVTNPKIWAYDKERDAADENYIHVDRPSRIEIATNRHALREGQDPDTIDTVGGRQWWTWEVGKAIADFWFTRNGYDYASVQATALENDDMTDIQWRRSGEIFLTWPTTGTAMEDYTRDYYPAAAQEAPECAVMIEGHLYAYFTNTPGWEHVFCHAWNTDAEGVNHDLLTPPSPYEGGPCYPGALCEMIGYDKDGYEVWRIDLTAAGVTTYPNGGILFNNGIDDNHVYEHDMNHDYYTGTGTLAAKEQSSDFAYSTGACYDYCGLIVLGRSLSNIIRNGVVNGPVYTIEDDIVGVWFDPKAVTEIEVDGETHTMYGALYCKDLNNFVTTPYVEKSLQKDGEIDYILQRTSLMNGKNRYDQSNWVKLTLSTQYPGIESMNAEAQKALLSSYVGLVLPAESVRGQLVNNYNPEMRLALQALPGSSTVNNYYLDPNVFVTANFIGTQDCTEAVNEYGHEERNTYFMVTPKPQEYAKITWAVYGTDGTFHVPQRDSYAFVDGEYQWMNEGDLNGYFPVQWDLQTNPGLVAKQAYSFHAIIRLADQEQAASTGGTTTLRAAQNEVPYKPYTGTVKYVVSPIDLSTDGIITAVTDINATTKTVRQVRYYNLAGIESTEPFDGINVVVTTYTDGSKSTAKILK